MRFFSFQQTKVGDRPFRGASSGSEGLCNQQPGSAFLWIKMAAGVCGKIQMERMTSTVTRPPPVALTRWISASAKRRLGFFLLAMALVACRQSPREPVTLRYTHGWSSQPDELSKVAALSQQFTRETGIHVKSIPTPENTLDTLDLWHRLLPEGSSGTDLLRADVVWSPVLEPDLIDLKPYFADEISSLEPPLLSGYTVNGKLVAIPYRVSVGVLEYRADHLREYGYEHPPRTWDELESMAERIQAGERAKGKKNFWGYVWQGTAEALTCNALEWQVAEGGGRIIEKDRTISVNNPAAIRAWQRARRWIGRISPPSVVAYRERDTMSVFDSGGAAFDRIWLWTTSTLSGQSPQPHWRTSPPLVKTGYTRVPGGPGGSAGTLGGSGLAVSRHSVHRHEAIEMVRFLIRAQIQSSGKNESVSASLLAQPEVYDMPSISGSHDSETSNRRESDVVSRPSSAAGPAYEKVTKAYIAAVHSVLTGQRGAQEAAAELEKQLIEITSFRTGPPKTAD
jgi:trehalose/maltose transport system substrate-binding protein